MMIEIDELAETIVLVARGGLVGTHVTMFATGNHSSQMLVGTIAALWCLEEIAGIIEQRKHVKKHLGRVHRVVVILPKWLHRLLSRHRRIRLLLPERIE